MAAATKHVGCGITVSTTYEQPYALARKFAILDHLSKGRVGWNVVTSAQESAAPDARQSRSVWFRVGNEVELVAWTNLPKRCSGPLAG